MRTSAKINHFSIVNNVYFHARRTTFSADIRIFTADSIMHVILYHATAHTRIAKRTVAIVDKRHFMINQKCIRFYCTTNIADGRIVAISPMSASKLFITAQSTNQTVRCTIFVVYVFSFPMLYFYIFI